MSPDVAGLVRILLFLSATVLSYSCIAHLDHSISIMKHRLLIEWLWLVPVHALSFSIRVKVQIML